VLSRSAPTSPDGQGVVTAARRGEDGESRGRASDPYSPPFAPFRLDDVGGMLNQLYEDVGSIFTLDATTRQTGAQGAVENPTRSPPEPRRTSPAAAASARSPARGREPQLASPGRTPVHQPPPRRHVSATARTNAGSSVPAAHASSVGRSVPQPISNVAPRSSAGGSLYDLFTGTRVRVQSGSAETAVQKGRTPVPPKRGESLPLARTVPFPERAYKPSEEAKRFLSSLLTTHTCYDLVPHSSKLLVLDAQLTVAASIRAFKRNRFATAPIWDTEKKQFAGLLSNTYFVGLLREAFENVPRGLSSKDEGGEAKLRELWRSHLEGKLSARTNDWGEFVSVHPDDPIHKACNVLFQNELRYIGVVDDHTVLAVLSKSRILKYFVGNFSHTPDFMHRTLEELGIGTFEKVMTLLRETPLAMAVDILASKNFQSLPVVDDQGIVVDVFTSRELMFVGEREDALLLLERPVFEVVDMVRTENGAVEGVRTCQRGDSLQAVMRSILTSRMNHLICVDTGGHIEGIVSLTDILYFLYDMFKLEMRESSDIGKA